jgi:predicted nucleic acid-binding protein
VGDCIAVIIGDPAYTLKTAWISEKGWVFPDGKPFDFVDCIRWAYMRDVVYQAIGNR